MRAYFIESEPGCARLAPADAEKVERDVADALAGKRPCAVYMLPPGRRVVALDVPEEKEPVLAAQQGPSPNVKPRRAS